MVIRMMIGAVIGGLIGFALYRYVGCQSGQCPLTANPYIAVILWAVIGIMIATGYK
ncbi:MAG: DUF6132 family protein [Chlamydiota bacterium]|nr:DUF6132 family protein [Chlamydiota bacterium]